jgi:hypothetical protein
MDKAGYGKQSSDFDPEKANMSKMTTLSTWVADKHQANAELMKVIQTKVAISVPQNPFAVHMSLPIENDEGDSRYFGKTFYAIEAIEVPYLQSIKQLSQVNPILSLEVGAGMGDVSWKAALAHEQDGVHHANELSRVMVDKLLTPFVNGRLKEAGLEESRVTKLSGNCLDLLKQNQEAYKIILSKNVEHFFNPVTHQRFIAAIEVGLQEGGKAFLCAHSFHFGDDPSGQVKAFYSTQRAKPDLYPGFMQYNVEFTQWQQATLESKLSSPTRPADDAEFVKRDLTLPITSQAIVGKYGLQTVTTVKQMVTENAFSPFIYKAAIAPHPFLKVVDSFFIKNDGSRSESTAWVSGITHAGAIVEKLNKTDVLIKTITSNDASKLAAVLDRAPDIINKADATGTPPLHYSLGHGGTPVNPTIVKLLITKAADVNQHATQTGDTPIHVAAFSGSIGAMSLLLSKGANVDDFNTQHKTPLHTLIENRSVPAKQKLTAIKFLLHKSASITEKDSDGHDAIYLAHHHFPDASAILGHPETLASFAEFEASISGSIEDFTI